ncbi:MAG: hypothetical protein ACJA08_002833 [Cyclobacteriaceae bacterium]|jgi:hypothetical protein
MEEIINRVAGSALLSLDMDDYIDQSARESFDLKPALFQELLLKEKDFRQYLKDFDWEIYRGKNVNVTCTADAIIPSWAYMLVAAKLSTVANIFTIGNSSDLEKAIIDAAIDLLIHDVALNDTKVVIKGCGNLENRDYAYFKLTQKAMPLVASIMYGEPCSTVPVYKRPRQVV